MISVVIPAFNEEKFFHSCLESLRNQDYEGGYEIIVVDNGSTDGTAQIAVEFGATIVSCPKKGVVYARQAGVEAALGDVIVQADADTIYPRDWVARIERYFALHPESAALAGSYIYNTPPFWARFEYYLRYFLNRLRPLFLGNLAFISGANFAFRREAFLKAGGYNEHSLYPDQWGIAHRLARVGKIFYDRNLTVVTSSRRVEKPVRIILLETLLNLSGVLRHFIKYIFHLVVHRETKFRPVQVVRLTIPVILLLVITVLAYAYAAPTSQVFGKVYYQGQATGKTVALTFDDGPNEPYTSEILNILDRYGVKATFFVIGSNVESYPETTRRIIASGHVLGNHSYSHRANHALSENRYIGKDIELAQEAIFKVTGIKPHLYRPPHGKKSPWELQYLKKSDFVEVTWSTTVNEVHDDLVFGKPIPKEVIRHIISTVKPGRIILLHDGYGTEHGDVNSDKSLTVKILPSIIEELQKQGYEFVTVPELLNLPAYNQ